MKMRIGLCHIYEMICNAGVFLADQIPMISNHSNPLTVDDISCEHFWNLCYVRAFDNVFVRVTEWETKGSFGLKVEC